MSYRVKSTDGTLIEFDHPVTMASDGAEYALCGELVRCRNSEEVFTDIGRVPGRDGLHILQRQDGSIITVGGYYVHPHNKKWYEVE